MADEADNSPGPFADYAVTVDGLGTVTVIDPAGEPGYRYRLPSGGVSACAAQSGTPCEANAAADLAYAFAHPRVPALSDSQIYAQHLDGGYVDSPTGLKLKTTERAQRIFANGLTLIREGLDAGLITAGSPFSVWDFDDVEHVLTVADYRALILRYGLFCQQLFAEYAP